MPRLPAGHRNGRLEILEYVGNPQNPKHPKYRCRCDCGAIVEVTFSNLRTTHSCGCLRIEQLTARSRTHGRSDTPEFRIWADMIARCRYAPNKAFAQYGGRGIYVCQRWLESFVAFLADMGPRPSPKHTIDRINNDGNYEPENCRWATRYQQRVNQRRTQTYAFQGVTGTLKDLAKHVGLSYTAVRQRVALMNWPIEKALTTPVKQRHHRPI